MAIKLPANKFVKELARKNKVVPFLERAIEMKEYEFDLSFRQKHGDDAFHPSSDCLPSVIDLYWDKVQPTHKKHSGSLRKAFAIGHFWHGYIQHLVVDLELADKSAIERKGERRWGKGQYQWARGSADIAPATIPIYGDYLVDIKTMKGADYRQNGIPNWCRSKYIAQVNVYMDWFDLEHAIILCVEKDSPHSFKEYEIKRNQPLIDAIYLKWKTVGEHIEANAIPEVDVTLPFHEGDIIQ